MNISNQMLNVFSVYRSKENGNVFLNGSYKLLNDKYEKCTVILTEKSIINSKALSNNVKSLENLLDERDESMPIAITVTGTIGRPKIDGDNFSMTVFGYSISPCYFDNNIK